MIKNLKCSLRDAPRVKKIKNSQKGVSLIITFLIMTIMLAIVLSITIILFSEVKIIGNIGSSVSAFYSAETGIEKTLYFNNKQVPNGGVRGLCNIQNVCDLTTDCLGYTQQNLATDGSDGCDVLSCSNCEVNYNSAFDNRSYQVNARIIPYSSTSIFSIFMLEVKGIYKDTLRVIETNITK